jgi:hypothetical protein
MPTYYPLRVRFHWEQLQIGTAQSAAESEISRAIAGARCSADLASVNPRTQVYFA